MHWGAAPSLPRVGLQWHSQACHSMAVQQACEWQLWQVWHSGWGIPASGVSKNICVRISPRTLAGTVAVSCTLPYGSRSSHCGCREKSRWGLQSVGSCQQACARPSRSPPPHTAKEKCLLVMDTDGSIRKNAAMAHSWENYHQEGSEAGLGSSDPTLLVALMGCMWLGTGMKVWRMKGEGSKEKW